AEERVFGLALEGASVAWPLNSFGERPELREATLNGQKVVILWDGRTRTAAAFAPEAEGDTNERGTLSLDSSASASPWVDKETASRWAIAGRAVSGPRKGQTLRWLPGVMVKWYAWVAEYPQTSIVQTQSGRGPK